ncbi:MAG: hypothetical protein FD147_2562 [Chloroflexi bacterium]|nr:MAG: hypothetical protein FD147_2562 [Chloroflexota bacterium]
MEYIVPAVVGLVGVIAGALITNAFQHKKIDSGSRLDDAEINEKIRLACVGLIEPLQDQINELKKELKEWKNWAGAMYKQLKGLGHEPVPFVSTKKDL